MNELPLPSQEEVLIWLWENANISWTEMPAGIRRQLQRTVSNRLDQNLIIGFNGR